MTIGASSRFLLSRALYPGVLVAVALAAATLVPGRSEARVVASVLAPVLVGLWALEGGMPYTLAWRPTWRVFGLDVFYTLISSQLATRLTKLALVTTLAAWTASWTRPLGLWPDHWSLWAQIPLAVAVADLALYMAHRLMHDTDIGWRIHFVHHSPTKLHLFASARSHPLNVGIKLLTETGILILLGVPAEVMTVWFCLMTTNGLLQHANIDVRTGPLDLFLATPEVHRTHHDAHLGPNNFGSTTTIWDRLFGTFQSPALVPVGQVGIEGSTVPEHYLAHLGVPFRRPVIHDRIGSA